MAARTTAARATADGEQRPAVTDRRVVTDTDWIGQDLTVEVEPGETVTVDKVVAVYTCRDRGISEPVEAATLALGRAPGFGQLRDSHARAWGYLWERTPLE